MTESKGESHIVGTATKQFFPLLTQHNTMTDLSSVPAPTPASSSNTALAPFITAFEELNKWKGCPGAPERWVYTHNRNRAAATGFPTVLQKGRETYGLTDHEIAAVFGWTTGDYRFVNPIARGGDQQQEDTVEFEDYPFLPQKLTKVTCVLTRQDVMPYVHILNAAIRKLPKETSPAILWRGHRRQIDVKSVGNVLVLPGFTSVSRDREQALAFAEQANEGRSNKRTLIAVVQHESSRSLTKLSARRDESEVLFPLDTTFEVVPPPEGHDADNDQLAAQQATERLRKSIPDAEITVVYLKEVKTGDWA